MQRKRKKTVLLTALFILMLAFSIFITFSALLLKEVSEIIGENGLLLDVNTANNLEYSDTMAVSGSAEDSGKYRIWFMPETAEQLSVNSYDGYSLSALLYRQPEQSCKKWVVLVHGYSSYKETMQEYAQKYYEKGYSILMPDLRAHGGSQGDFVGMGWLDRLDIFSWLDLIVTEAPDAEIVLHGLSMGASTVMMAAGEKLPQNVLAIIEDCGYSSVWDILECQLKKCYKFPAFPIMYGVNLLATDKLGYSWKEASAVEMVKKSETPILFIHGSEDDIVPVDMVFTLYRAANCEKRLLIIEDAGHAMSVYREPERYWKEIFEFIEAK